MKPASLSTRLGLSFAAMGAALVILLASLAYLALTHELASLARSDLTGKLQQLQHRLVEDGIVNTDPLAQSHIVKDLLLGHNNMQLAVFSTGPKPRLLLASSEHEKAPVPNLDNANQTTVFQQWRDASDHRMLTASQYMYMADGSKVLVQLSFDNSVNATLLSAYLRSTLLALPFLLVLISAGAWWLMQQGLSPLNQFRKVAALISTHDLSHRLPAEGLPQELRDLAHSINFMLHRLDYGVQQLSQFSDDLAHELRTPISNLMGKMQVTLSRARPAEEYKTVLESSTEELERLARIVTDMLFLAQISHPGILLPFKPVALHDEAARVIDLFSVLAEDKEVEISLSGKGFINGDRLMVQRVISNLLSNAIRHSQPRSCIEIELSQQQQEIRLHVRNIGSGIAAHHIPHIFKRFYRADQALGRSERGTGLGLAIADSIMTLHNGSISVSSDPETKTTAFTLIFPVHGSRIAASS